MIGVRPLPALDTLTLQQIAEAVRLGHLPIEHAYLELERRLSHGKTLDGVVGKETL